MREEAAVLLWRAENGAALAAGGVRAGECAREGCERELRRRR